MAVEPITPRPERKVWKAGDLARRIRTLLESEIGWVWIEGECSNVRPAASSKRSPGVSASLEARCSVLNACSGFVPGLLSSPRIGWT